MWIKKWYYFGQITLKGLHECHIIHFPSWPSAMNKRKKKKKTSPVPKEYLSPCPDGNEIGFERIRSLMRLQSRQVPISFSMQRKNLEHLERLSFVFVVFPPLTTSCLTLSHSLRLDSKLCLGSSWLWEPGPQAAPRALRSVHVRTGSSTCL